MTEVQIQNLLKTCIDEVLPDLEEGAFERAERLADLGANSIDRVEIVTLALERLGLKVAPTEVGNVKDIRGLVAYLQRKSGA